MTCAGLVRELDADKVAFEEAFRRLGIGGGGGGGGPLDVAAELGTGRRPWAGLSGRPRADEDEAPVVPADVLSGHSMMEDGSNNERVDELNPADSSHVRRRGGCSDVGRCCTVEGRCFSIRPPND